MSRPNISATVLTYNNASTLHRCLESISWVKDIVVVDSLSQDRSVEIAKGFTQKVYLREWRGFISQRNFSKEQTVGEWILWVDADEVISDTLREEIELELDHQEPRIAGYLVPRCTYYLGRWIRHGAWYPDLSVRLFRSEGQWWGGEEPHAAVQTKGPLRRLGSDILHFNYSSFGQQIRTIDHYATLSARRLHHKGIPFRLLRMLFHPPWRFVKEYIIRQGFRDGMPGLIIVVATMFYVFSKFAKLWELQHTASERDVEDRLSD